MDAIDGLVFMLLAALCIISSYRVDHKHNRLRRSKKDDVVVEDDREKIWKLRENHIKSLSVPYEQGQEIVGRIGALCGFMTHDEMYKVFEYARKIVREREGFDKEIH